MKGRCYYKEHVAYASYGGRGITVAPEWLGRGGFQKFLAHMGPRPPRTSIDRIDPNGNYEPGNCRWATFSLQYRNIRPELMPARQRNQKRWRVIKAVGSARVALQIFGRLLGYRATEGLMASIRQDLEDTFGPPRNMAEPKPGELVVEEAFLSADYGFLSEHYAGLDNLAKEWRGHGDWPQLTGRMPRGGSYSGYLGHRKAA